METKVSRLERQIENFYNREDKKKDQVVELQTQLNKVRGGNNYEQLINICVFPLREDSWYWLMKAMRVIVMLYSLT